MAQGTETASKWRQEREAQDQALATFEFGPSFPGGDWMSPTWASCETCGAAVRIMPGAPNEEQPAVKHHRWHTAEVTR